MKLPKKNCKYKNCPFRAGLQAKFQNEPEYRPVNNLLEEIYETGRRICEIGERGQK